MKQPNEKYLNQSVMKAAALLELFSDEERELGITAIASRLDMPISTTHRILSTLEHVGYISQNPENGKYHLGIRCYMLGTRVSLVQELSLIARPHLAELSSRFNETAHLYLSIGSGAAICAARVTANRRLFTAPESGRNINLHTSASGKCLLAFMSPVEQRQVISQLKFEPYTPYSITSEEALRAELEKVQQQRYATEREEGDLGIFCIGAPVFSNQNTCVAAVSLSLPVIRLPESMEEMRDQVMETARKISRDLGNRGL